MLTVSYKDIEKITFPVYSLHSENIILTDGLLYLENEILDDKNMPGETLGIRRLQSPHKNLCKINRQINDFISLLKNPKKTFIDTKGIIFTYEKTQFMRLKYVKIKKVVKNGRASILKLHGTYNSFVVPRPPPVDVEYAGILYFKELPWLLYEYSNIKLKDTRRMI